MTKPTFYIEVTDTYGGEANYCWVNRYKVTASTQRGAVGKVSRHMGLHFRLDYDTGDLARYNARKAAICAFVSWDPTAHETYYEEL